MLAEHPATYSSRKIPKYEVRITNYGVFVHPTPSPHPWACRKKAKPPGVTTLHAGRLFDLSGRTCAACVSRNVIFLSPSSCITALIRDQTSSYTFVSWLICNSAWPWISRSPACTSCNPKLPLDAKATYWHLRRRSYGSLLVNDVTSATVFFLGFPSTPVALPCTPRPTPGPRSPCADTRDRKGVTSDPQKFLDKLSLFSLPMRR